MKDKFRDRNGRYITQGLFVETAAANKEFVMYRLKDGITEQYGHLPVLKHLYLETLDPTEYRFANKYLGGWEHWERLLGNAIISREIEKWRTELRVKMVSLGLQQICDVAQDASEKGRLQAARYLADEGWVPKKAGRPTKADIKNEQKFNNMVADEISSDLERIRGELQ